MIKTAVLVVLFAVLLLTTAYQFNAQKQLRSDLSAAQARAAQCVRSLKGIDNAVDMLRDQIKSAVSAMDDNKGDK